MNQRMSRERSSLPNSYGVPTLDFKKDILQKKYLTKLNCPKQIKAIRQISGIGNVNHNRFLCCKSKEEEKTQNINA